MAEEQDTFEVTIIGAGPGGYRAAERAAQLGFKTCLIERRDRLGGTCLNVGCIPSKALLASTEHFYAAKHHFARHGIQLNDLRLDVAAMMKRKADAVATLAKGVQTLMKVNKVTCIQGHGRLLDAHTVEIELAEGGTRRIETENVLLATGSEPIGLDILPFDGVRVLSSDDAIALEAVPDRLIVVGGGPIGLELGSVWARLGSEVTVIEFLPRIASSFDPEISRTLQRALEAQGMAFHLNSRVEAGRHDGSDVVLNVSKNGEPIEFRASKVLVAVGRRPFTQGLGLEAAGVQLTPRGRIAVDARLRTSVSSICAIGDVVEGPMLAHKAEEEGIAAVERWAGKGSALDHDLIPSVIYTAPEAAAVGLTDEMAQQRGIPVRKGRASLAANGRAIAADAGEGFVKVVADAESDRVLGVHVIGPSASELIAEAVVLMSFGGSAEDLGRTVHAHPTLSESLRDAALAAFRK